MIPRAAIAAAAALALAGCAVTWTGPEGGELGAYTGLAPSDEVQTVDVAVIGVSVDATRQSIDLGYKRIRQTRIPAFDAPAVVPDVSFSATVDQSAITDRLTVGGAE